MLPLVVKVVVKLLESDYKGYLLVPGIQMWVIRASKESWVEIFEKNLFVMMWSVCSVISCFIFYSLVLHLVVFLGQPHLCCICQFLFYVLFLFTRRPSWGLETRWQPLINRENYLATVSKWLPEVIAMKSVAEASLMQALRPVGDLRKNFLTAWWQLLWLLASCHGWH